MIWYSVVITWCAILMFPILLLYTKVIDFFWECIVFTATLFSNFTGLDKYLSILLAIIGNYTIFHWLFFIIGIRDLVVYRFLFGLGSTGFIIRVYCIITFDNFFLGDLGSPIECGIEGYSAFVPFISYCFIDMFWYLRSSKRDACF